MDILITCHTEFGFVFDNEIIYDKNYKSGVSIGVKNLIDVCERYNAKISFAVMPEVVEYLPSIDEHDIGLHIHPGNEIGHFRNHFWIRGDKYLQDKCKSNNKSSSALWDYSYVEQYDLILTGLNLMEQRFNLTPKFFVSGRWSENNDTMRVLTDLRFSHDCTAIPTQISDHYNWSLLPRICPPYTPNVKNYQQYGDLNLLMVPVSQCYPRGSVSPEISHIVGIAWLKASFLEYLKQDVPVFHIFLHSPAMTEKYFLNNMNILLKYINDFDCISFKKATEVKKPTTFHNYKTDFLKYITKVNTNLIRYKLHNLVGI